MGKFVKSQLERISALTTQEIPALIGAGATEEQYNVKRAELNAHIIQMCLGGEMTTVKHGKHKGENSFKFNHSLPDKSEVATASELIGNFVANVENPFLASLGGATGSDGDSLGIAEIDSYQAQVVAFDKVRQKKLRKLVVGEGCIPFYQMKLGATDVARLAGLGEKARNHRNLVVSIVAGSTLLVVAAGITTAVILLKKKKDEQEAVTATADDTVEVSDEDEVELDEEPEVVLD